MLNFQRLLPLFSNKIIYANNLDRCLDSTYNIPAGQINKLIYVDNNDFEHIYCIKNKSEKNPSSCWSNGTDIAGTTNIFNGDEYAIFKANRLSGTWEQISEWFLSYAEAKTELINVAKKCIKDDKLNLSDFDFSGVE